MSNININWSPERLELTRSAVCACELIDRSEEQGCIKAERLEGIRSAAIKEIDAGRIHNPVNPVFAELAAMNAARIHRHYHGGNNPDLGNIGYGGTSVDDGPCAEDVTWPDLKCDNFEFVTLSNSKGEPIAEITPDRKAESITFNWNFPDLELEPGQPGDETLQLEFLDHRGFRELSTVKKALALGDGQFTAEWKCVGGTKPVEVLGVHFVAPKYGLERYQQFPARRSVSPGWTFKAIYNIDITMDEK